MNYSSGRHEIYLVFYLVLSLSLLLAGLTLDSAAWYIQYPLVAAAVVVAVVGFRSTWNESDL